MIFKENTKAIYLQVADKICDDVMLGAYLPDTRIPSVREYAAMVQVNANTVMRTYEYLSQHGIIYNKRGIGFFIEPQAKENITALRNATFFDDEITYVFGRLLNMGITPDQLRDLYSDYCKNNQKK